jgi:hypothetical protein
MAPTASTPVDRSASIGALCESLIEMYRRERDLYQDVLRLSRDQGQLIRRGESLSRLRHLLTTKRERLDEITRLEDVHAQVRRSWELRRGELNGSLPIRLQQSLQAVGSLIEEILKVEAENDRLFIQLGDAPAAATWNGT